MDHFDIGAVDAPLAVDASDRHDVERDGWPGQRAADAGVEDQRLPRPAGEDAREGEPLGEKRIADTDPSMPRTVGILNIGRVVRSPPRVTRESAPRRCAGSNTSCVPTRGSVRVGRGRARVPGVLR